MKQLFHSRENRLNFPIRCRYLSIDVELRRTLNDLKQAVRVIEEKLSERDIHYFSFEIESLGNPLFGDSPEDANTIFSAWDTFNSDFWNVLLEKTYLYQDVKNWFSAVERVLGVAETCHRITASLWEDEMTQLGAPVATHFAMAAVEFVPFYTRLLQKWDMDHEVEQAGTINRLVRKHGLCSEIEELLFFRFTSCEGQHGLDHLNDLSGVLENHYGDFTNSALFKRVVIERHKAHERYVKDDKEAGHRSGVSFHGVFCRPVDCQMERAALRIYERAGISPHHRT